MASEKTLLTFHTDRSAGAGHEAGSLVFGPGGELYISTGDDTNPFESNGYTPIDERPGRLPFDAQRSSANTHDLRGKILRIVPQSDGTYTIPEGNLFPANGSAGLPEIFAMGNRNPFRISVDAETGWLYWGDIGPDANGDNSTRGPRGYDELNQARGAGNFGWPYSIADNKAYRDYNFATGVSGSLFNPSAPVNNSPNNTGAANLPPAQGAMIWYPYGASAQFPELDPKPGVGGRTIMAGPVYHFDPELNSSIKLPAYYDDTLFIYDWSRHWIREVKLDANGNILKINPVASDIPLARPMDMELGPDGALYVLEWGSGFGGNNADAQLVRIEFLGSPQIVSADFDENNLIDGADFLAWQRGVGATGGAMRGEGDANVDGKVDASDLGIWTGAFGSGGALSAAMEATSWRVALDQAFAASADEIIFRYSPVVDDSALKPKNVFDVRSFRDANRPHDQVPRSPTFSPPHWTSVSLESRLHDTAYDQSDNGADSKRNEEITGLARALAAESDAL
jgi:cytochrome c